MRNKETQFLKDDFTNWKRAVLKFKDHEGSKCHRRAIEMETENIPDVGEVLSSVHAKEKEKNREMFHLVLYSIQFLARQGILLRGHGSGEDGNFNQLLKLRCCDNEALKNWLTKKSDTYTFPEIQNEILQIVSLSIVRDIAKNVKENWFSIMADECTGVDNKEQLVICIRWVDNDLEVHEDLIGLHFLESIESDEIVKVLMDILLWMNISLKKCRGQCYDGASNMSGRKSGVATQLENIESRALYIHCYGHSLNLACQDAIKQNKLMRDTLDDTREITKLIKKSPKRDVIFKKIKTEITPEGSPGIRVHCPTRWTVKPQSLESILKNYSTLQQCWGDAKDAADDTETKARLGGVDSSMKTFDYFFGCNIGVQLLGYAENFAKALQETIRSAMDGQELAKMTVTTLKSLRNDEAFESLWKQIQSRREDVDVAEPTLPRKRWVPVRYEEGQAPPEFIDSVLVHYHV
ncbi:zinc finger MYM-type protein 1-like [Palaemon carinicauda]|uniref:zinc finger MYM-type protein 1-like n=1 Tax=Palaemon carinicauda TaxID=392227 RepID=UPI0035B68184